MWDEAINAARMIPCYPEHQNDRCKVAHEQYGCSYDILHDNSIVWSWCLLIIEWDSYTFDVTVQGDTDSYSDIQVD